MQTIIIVLNPKEMSNPDLDIRYALPDRIEELTDGKIKDNGYDYLSDNKLGLWLETEDSKKNVEPVINFVKTEKVLENDLSHVAEIYISDDECADIEKSSKIYPTD